MKNRFILSLLLLLPIVATSAAAQADTNNARIYEFYVY